MAGIEVDVEDFLVAGWCIYGKGKPLPDVTKSSEFTSFRECFGTEPLICVELWKRMRPEEDIHQDSLPKHLLWTLHFMWAYPTQSIHSFFQRVDPKTLRVWIWRFIPAMAEEAVDLIGWENRHMGTTPIPGHYVYVDGTVCPIQEPRNPFSKGWSAKKLGK